MIDQRLQICAVAVDALAATGLFDELDEDIRARYPGAPVNGIDSFEFKATDGYAVVATITNEPIGCGAFRPLTSSTIEIKRMFVRRDYRGRGIARRILSALEEEARRRGHTDAILETGTQQPEAIALYRRCGYHEIALYEPYVGNPYSVCFGKML